MMGGITANEDSTSCCSVVVTQSRQMVDLGMTYYAIYINLF